MISDRLESDIEQISFLHGPPLSVVSDCLRGMLIPEEDSTFIDVDFSAIEARVLAWLAGDEKILDIFKGDGKVYERAASEIFKVPVDQITDKQRLVGKVAVLALGYQGGHKAFDAMAKQYGLKGVKVAEAKLIVANFRKSRPKTVKYWAHTQRAAMKAVKNKGKAFRVGPIGRELRYKVNGSFLWCRLPSGRLLCYPYPKLQMVTAPWGDEIPGLTYKTEVNRKWVTKALYGGLLVENNTQGVARDLLSEAMLRLDAHKYDIVIHTHDEAAVEVPKIYSDRYAAVKKIFCEQPIWCMDLPIDGDGWTGDRYRK